MTMGKWTLCVRWSACGGSPSSISLACFKQEEWTKLMFISFSNGTGSALENSLNSGYPFDSQASLRNVERQCCWKRGSGDGQRLWNYRKARLSDLSIRGKTNPPKPGSIRIRRGSVRIFEDPWIRGSKKRRKSPAQCMHDALRARARGLDSCVRGPVRDRLRPYVCNMLCTFTRIVACSSAMMQAYRAL